MAALAASPERPLYEQSGPVAQLLGATVAALKIDSAVLFRKTQESMVPTKPQKRRAEASLFDSFISTLETLTIHIRGRESKSNAANQAPREQR